MTPKAPVRKRRGRELKPRPIAPLRPRQCAAKGKIEGESYTTSDVALAAIITLARKEQQRQRALGNAGNLAHKIANGL